VEPNRSIRLPLPSSPSDNIVIIRPSTVVVIRSSSSIIVDPDIIAVINHPCCYNKDIIVLK